MLAGAWGRGGNQLLLQAGRWLLVVFPPPPCSQVQWHQGTQKRATGRVDCIIRLKVCLCWAQTASASEHCGLSNMLQMCQWPACEGSARAVLPERHAHSARHLQLAAVRDVVVLVDQALEHVGVPVCLALHATHCCQAVPSLYTYSTFPCRRAMQPIAGCALSTAAPAMPASYTAHMPGSMQRSLFPAVHGAQQHQPCPQPCLRGAQGGRRSHSCHPAKPSMTPCNSCMQGQRLTCSSAHTRCTSVSQLEETP